MSSICEKCHVFKLFGEKCWYYWEGKKECSQFRATPEEEPHHGSVKEALPRIPEHERWRKRHQ